MRETLLRSAGAGATDVAAEAIEAWAARRLTTYDDAERSLCFGRLDLEGAEDPLYVGRRWVDDDEGVVVVNWQAPAARPFYTATPAQPHGVTSPPALPYPRAHDHGNQRRGARRLPRGRGAWWTTSCSRSSSAPATRGCATSSRRSRPTSTASSRASRSRRSSSRVAPVPGRRPSVCTARPTSLFAHRASLRRILVVGPNPTFMDYVSHVLPSLGEDSVEQRAVDELVEGVAVTLSGRRRTSSA